MTCFVLNAFRPGAISTSDSSTLFSSFTHTGRKSHQVRHFPARLPDRRLTCGQLPFDLGLLGLGKNARQRIRRGVAMVASELRMS